MRPRLTAVALAAAIVALVAPSANAHITDFAPLIPGAVAPVPGVPDPGDPDGRGVVFVDVRAAVGLACADERYAGLDAPTEMHIHRGVRGRAGSVAIDVGPALAGTRCVNAPKALLQRIVDGPRRFYVDMHTGPFPGGAIRGQLTPSD